MRLTLRTMLAHLDQVLDPADAELLGKKIEESDFASGLVARIKGVMKKLRMDAPKLDGKGMGNDANTVAEYLDSSLPQDRVGEFERVCLESDKHLCEVASCHQILTIVLGKPADVPAGLRERVYLLGDPEHVTPQVAVPPVETVAARQGAPPVQKANGQAVERPATLEVPDYLRAGRQPSLWFPVAVAAAALLLALLGLRAMGRFDSSHPLAKAMTRSPQVAAVADDGSKAAKSEAEKSSGADAQAAANAGKSDAGVAASDNATSATATAAVATPTAPGSAATETPAAAVAATTPAESLAVSPAASPDKIAAAAPTPVPAIPDVPDPTDVPRPPPAVAVTPKMPKGKGIAAAPAKPLPIDVGRYISDGQLLATFGAADALWHAKQAQGVLTAGERLIVLPPYRPQLALPSAVQLSFAGEGIVRMAEPDANRTPRVIVECGRFLAATAGKAGAQVELDLAGIKGIVTLVDADSVLAIKAMRWVPPGTNPESIEGMSVVEMYNANGRATWQQIEHDVVTIPTHFVHVYVGDDAPETHGPFLPPDWIDAKSVKPIDRDAAIVLERLVDNERPLSLSLQEVMKDRRVEIRSLAARCLAALGDFEPILRELSDANQYSFWAAEFETLRHALNHSPETAAKVRETLSLLRAADAKDLYRLLGGYNEEQLTKGGEAGQLVRYLESDQMDIRVLAHANLVAITGAWGFYRPERLPAQMKTAIQNWRERKDKGAIIYRMPPSPLDSYKPIAPAGIE